MNNKGFAVSTILYGLSIMGFLIVLVLIGLMASNRSNTRSFVQQVEDELNRFSSKQTVITQYNNNPYYPQEFFTLDGTNAYWYKIELWSGNTYKSATFKITPNTLIFFYIGNGTAPTIACIDGDSRDNCAAGSDNLIMSTEITGDGINGKDQVEQDAVDRSINPRIVYLHGTNGAKNTYQYTTNNQYKARISLASMDEDGGYLDDPSNDIAGVFYLGSNNHLYSCNGGSASYNNAFTGDQDQQWTIINNQATNVKHKNCTVTYTGQEHHNALF